MSRRKPILVFADWYEPGFKGGGPIRSCVNFVFNMKADYQIYVFTSDRDLGSDSPYTGIVLDEWIALEEGVKILYASPSFLTWTKIRQAIQWVNPDFIYLNSMFSTYFSVLPMLMKRAGNIQAQLIPAPRGMLKRSALSFKARKKKLFFSLFRLARITRNIVFHATDQTEVQEIQQIFGTASKVVCIPNFHGLQHPYVDPPEKLVNELKVIFVGRIHPIKNLYYSLECLLATDAVIYFTVVGLIEDREYWDRCQSLIQNARPNFTFRLISDAPHQVIEHLIRQHHLFALLTTGENFGHAIFEALVAGRPVLISDQTPWRNLAAKQVGWDVPLAEEDTILQVLMRVAAMDHSNFTVLCRNAWNYCDDYLRNASVKEQYRSLFV